MADILNLKTVVNTVVSNNINAQLAVQAVADSVDIRDNLTDVVYPQLVTEVNNANAILSDIQDEKLIIADYVTTVTSNTTTSQNAVIDVLSMKAEITDMVDTTQIAVEDIILRSAVMETVWLGTHATPPTTTSVNSLPITAGAVYFNSITNSLYVYNGTVWVSMVNNLLVAADVKALYEDNLNTNEFNDAEKLKLAGIASNAEVNVNADWNAVNGDAQILNKPVTIAGFGITDAYTKTEITTHTNNTLNPHNVTKTQVGLSNADNTSDANKPISIATQTALNLKVDEISGSSLVQDTKITAYDYHLINTSNPHSVTKTQVGLGNVDNTSDSVKAVLSATKLVTTRAIALSGDVTGTANFDGSADISITTTIAANSVALGTDTTGNYVAGVTAGTGITITGTAGEGWSPTVTNSSPNVTTDISITHNTTTVVVNSSDGTDGTINAATTTLGGIMSATDKLKLDAVNTIVEW